MAAYRLTNVVFRPSSGKLGLRQQAASFQWSLRSYTLPQPKPDNNASQEELQKNTESKQLQVDPLKHPDYFEVHKLFTVKDLFDARVHWGHKEGSLNERMKPFVYGSRLGQLVIDLDKTAFHLRQALNFTAHVAYNSGIILLMGRNPQVVNLIEDTAKECGEYAHVRKWQRGIFTNATLQYGAVTRLPDLCIFMSTLNDVLTEHMAVKDAAKMLIPTIGIVDTNSDPNLITYPVPGNDDTPCAVELYCKLFKEAILRGKTKRKEDVDQNL